METLINIRDDKRVKTHNKGPHDGKYHRTLSLVLIALFDYKYIFRNTHGMTLGDLINRTGTTEVSKKYIKQKLKSWVRWRYVLKSVDNSPGRYLFRYKIAAKGRKFVKDIPIDKFKEYRTILINISQKT